MLFTCLHLRSQQAGARIGSSLSSYIRLLQWKHCKYFRVNRFDCMSKLKIIHVWSHRIWSACLVVAMILVAFFFPLHDLITANWTERDVLVKCRFFRKAKTLCYLWAYCQSIGKYQLSRVCQKSDLSVPKAHRAGAIHSSHQRNWSCKLGANLIHRAVVRGNQSLLVNLMISC
jgi:hypothetical protein